MMTQKKKKFCLKVYMTILEVIKMLKTLILNYYTNIE